MDNIFDLNIFFFETLDSNPIPSWIAVLVEGNSIDSVMDQLLDEEKTFFKFLDEELYMVDHFYRGNNGG